MLVRVHYATKRQMYSRGNCQKAFKKSFIGTNKTLRKRCRMFHDKFKKKAGNNPRFSRYAAYYFARFFFSISSNLSVFRYSFFERLAYLSEPSRAVVIVTITFFPFSARKPWHPCGEPFLA